MSTFLIKVIAVLAVFQIMAFLVWRRRLKRRLSRGLLAAVFLLFNAAWPVFALQLDRSQPPPDWLIAGVIRPFVTWQAGTLVWAVGLAAFLAAALVLYYLPRGAVRLVRRGASAGGEVDHGRRRFLVAAGRTAALAGASGAAVWGLIPPGRDLAAAEHDLFFPDLPRELDGLTIAHLTDLHVGLWMTDAEIGRAVETARDLDPDVVVFTGDLIDHSPEFAKTLTRFLPMLDKTPLGLYGIIGNHDIYTGAEAVTAAMNAAGLRMLRNEGAALLGEGLPLMLVGLDDPGRRWTGSGGALPLGRVLQTAPEGLFNVCLMHRPSGFDQSLEHRIPLTLCGHTHGGQFALPGGYNLADPFYRYTHGLHEENGSQLHVCAGLGSVGLPFRIGVPQEVGLLRLRRA